MVHEIGQHMMKHMKSVGALTLILIAWLLLVGCESNASVPTPTQSALAVSTVTPTQILSTAFPTVSPTLTFAPTLSPIEAKAKVLELLHNNGGCRLPCFWGFFPNQDTAEFMSFLQTIISEEGVVSIVHEELNVEIDAAVTEISFEIYTNIHQLSPSGSGVKHIYGDPLYREYFQYYTLSNLLSTYGVPDHVYVVLDTGIADMGLGIDLYLLSIEYPKDGWMAVFSMPLQHKQGIFLGCPSESFVNLRTWFPEENPIGAFIGGFGASDKSYLFTIEEATGLSIEEFYQRFKATENKDCLETPADIHK